MTEIPNGIQNDKARIPYSERLPQKGSIGSEIGVDLGFKASRIGAFKAKARRKLIEEGHFISSTRETNIPGTDIPRGIVERYERGEIFRVYMSFRREIREAEERGKDMSAKREEFKIFRQKATEFKKNMDILNKQFYPRLGEDDWERVHISDPELGEHNIPVVKLDLNPPKDEEKDERTPYFIVPTYIANPYQIAFFAESLALQGEKVYVMTYPEKYKMSGSSPDWIEKVRKASSLTPYVKLAEKLIDGLGLPEVNLVGTSMGAPIVMKMAADPSFQSRIKDLIAVDPPSLRERNKWKFIYDFSVTEGIPAGLDREQRVKSLKSSRPDLEVSMGRAGGWLEAPSLWAPILARTEVSKDELRRINPKGKFQVWIGGKSAITGKVTQSVLLDAESQRLNENPGFSPMKLIVVEGAKHQVLFSRLGIAPIITQATDSERTVINVNEKDLVHNGAQAILNGRRFSSSKAA